MKGGVFTLGGSTDDKSTFCSELGITTESDMSMNQVIEFEGDEIQVTAQTTRRFSNHFRLPEQKKEALQFIQNNK